MHAGPEFAVASTKVFTNMIATGLLFALTISDISTKKKKRNCRRLTASRIYYKSNSLMTMVLQTKPPDYSLGNKTRPYSSVRGLSTYIASEGALKMMEITYIHCMAIPGGELKHGPIALLSEDSPTLSLLHHQTLI